jgi:hypothetical protein
VKRVLAIAAATVLGVVAIWLVLFSVGLFLVGVVIGLTLRLLVVMEQRDQAQHDLTGAWFKIASLEAGAKRSVDVPLHRGGAR